MDAQSIRRALSDFFKFDPKDFFVKGSGTSFLVSLTKRSATINEPCPLGMFDASEGEDRKVGFRWGTIAGRQPEDFSPGGVPAFTIDVSVGEWYFFAKATANLTTLQWTSSEIVAQDDDPAPPPATTTTAYVLLGGVTVTEGGMTFSFTCGNVEMSICSLPLEDE